MAHHKKKRTHSVTANDNITPKGRSFYAFLSWAILFALFAGVVFWLTT